MKYTKKGYKKYKKRTGHVSTGMKKAIKNIVQKQLQPEIKYNTTLLTTGPSIGLTNGTLVPFYDLTNPPQNATDSGRIGDDVKLKSLIFRFSLAADASYVQGTARVMIVQWKNDSTVLPITSPQILMNGISGVQDSFSFPYEDGLSAGSFQVLYDTTIPMLGNAIGDGGGDQISRVVKVNLKYARKDINFTAGNNTGRNHIYAMAIQDRTIGAGTDRIVFSFSSRIYYTDA